jgi:hypothetical protein
VTFLVHAILIAYSPHSSPWVSYPQWERGGIGPLGGLRPYLACVGKAGYLSRMGQRGPRMGALTKHNSYLIFRDEVRSEEKDVSETHMHLGCHMKPYHEVHARGAWFSMCQENQSSS